jgi:hypothetical protein
VITADLYEYQLDSKDLKRHPLLEILLKTPQKDKADFEAIANFEIVFMFWLVNRQ